MNPLTHLKFLGLSSNTYAGIGSRETPLEVMRLMTRTSSFLSERNWILNSGGAGGADTAFENGVIENRAQIFIPWNGFNGRQADGETWILGELDDDALQIAKFFYHTPSVLTKGNPNYSKSVSALMTRNTYQILGRDLVTPVDFVLTWTPGGLKSGGTAQALKIADHMGIPIFNFWNSTDEDVVNFLKPFIRKD